MSQVMSQSAVFRLRLGLGLGLPFFSSQVKYFDSGLIWTLILWNIFKFAWKAFNKTVLWFLNKVLFLKILIIKDTMTGLVDDISMLSGIIPN